MLGLKIALVWDAVRYRPVDMYVPTFRGYYYQDTRCHIEKKCNIPSLLPDNTTFRWLISANSFARNIIKSKVSVFSFSALTSYRPPVRNICIPNFDVLLTVHLSIFIVCWPCISVYLSFADRASLYIYRFADRASQYIYRLLTVHLCIFIVCWPCISVYLSFCWPCISVYLSFADPASQYIYLSN